MKYRIKERYKLWQKGYTVYTGKNNQIKNYYEPIYVSDLGNVRGRNFRIKKDGYLYIKYKRKYYSLHRIVAELFIPNLENKPYVDHINRNKTDNRVKNLRWASPSENMRNTCRNKKCICIETGKIFDTCSEAEEFYNLRKHSVADACNPNNKRKTAGGFHFKYYEEEVMPS